jgi:hypothetical protein
VKRKHPRVLLALGWYDQRLHQGIERYAQEHGWHLCADVTRERVIPWGWEGDGILAWLGTGDDLADFVVQARRRVIQAAPVPSIAVPRPARRFLITASLAIRQNTLSSGSNCCIPSVISSKYVRLLNVIGTITIPDVKKRKMRVPITAPRRHRSISW